MAGAVGIDPLPLSLRELYQAYCGKEYAEWERLSVLLCLTYNMNRDPKTPARKPQDYFRRPGSKIVPRGGVLTAETFRAMKSAFVKSRD